MVWFVLDDDGIPTFETSSGARVCPYWSSKARAERAVAIWGGGMRVGAMPLDAWRSGELPGLTTDGLRVGVNWSGPRLVGWDFAVDEVDNRLLHALREGPYAVPGEGQGSARG